MVASVFSEKVRADCRPECTVVRSIVTRHCGKCRKPVTAVESIWSETKQQSPGNQSRSSRGEQVEVDEISFQNKSPRKGSYLTKNLKDKSELYFLC